MGMPLKPLARPLAIGIAVAAAAAPALAGAPAGTGLARSAVTSASVAKPAMEKWLSVGEGELVNLPAPVTDVWISNPTVADVHVSNARQIHLFGKEFGEATVFAADRAGKVVYSSTIRVSQNSTKLDQMLHAAMPDAQIKVTQVGQIAVLNGTVASPEDSAQAQRLVAGLLNPGVDPNAEGVTLKVAVVNRLRTATPLQVNLQVKFAEVSRSFLKNIGSNLTTRDQTGGFTFGAFSGRNAGAIADLDLSRFPLVDASSAYGLPAGSVRLPFDPATGRFVGGGTQYTFNRSDNARTTLGLAGKLFGMDVLQALDLGETNGQVTTLANPNLTALSGETGTFLAGGELPIPISQALGTISIEYKQFGVSLAYTPTVLTDGRISLRVRPEVSQLDYSNAVTLGSTRVPALTTRRAETTVELGSGQSFMIAGLMSNTHYNNFDKTPGIGDLPVLGALFKSNAFQRNETELVIIITPYLVNATNANDMRLPTDGYQAPTDLQRVLLGQMTGGRAPVDRPVPTMQAAPAGATTPTLGAAAPATATPVTPTTPAPAPAPVRPAAKPGKAPVPAPGFSTN